MTGEYTLEKWLEIENKVKAREITHELWSEIQAHKYDDMELVSHIFNNIERPVVLFLFPEKMFRKAISDSVKKMYKGFVTSFRETFDKYMSLRKSGATYKVARNLVLRNVSFTVRKDMIEQYRRPFRVRYSFENSDVDYLHQYGLERFSNLFFERFYQPIENMNGYTNRKNATE